MRRPPYAHRVRIDVSAEAAEFARANGGQVWVWTHRQACCSGTAIDWMRAAITPPKAVSGFVLLDADSTEGLQVFFRAAHGQRPEVLEIGLKGKRRPRIAAYWNGCLMA